MGQATLRSSVGAFLISLMASNVWASDFAGTPPAGNWNKVQTLAQGTHLSVEEKNGLVLDVNFLRLTDDSLIVNEDGKERAIPKGRVSTVDLLQPSSRQKNAAIVGAIFFGAGFGIGCAAAAYIADENSATAGERVQAGALMGSVWGGIAAAIAALHRPGLHHEELYRAR